MGVGIIDVAREVREELSNQGVHKEDKMFVKVQIQSSYKMFVKYNYKVLDDDYVNNLKELF